MVGARCHEPRAMAFEATCAVMKQDLDADTRERIEPASVGARKVVAKASFAAMPFSSLTSSMQQ